MGNASVTADSGKRPALARYGVALLAAALAIWVRLLLNPVLENRAPVPTLFVAVVFAAWYGGRGPAVVAVCLTTLGAWFLIVGPRSTFVIPDLDYRIGLGLYAAAAFACVAVIDRMRTLEARARQHARHLAVELERRRAAEALARESEERFRLIADSSPIIVWVTDKDGNTEFANQACRDFFGITQEQVRSLKLAALVHPDDAPNYIRTSLASLGSRRPWTCQARVRRADGEWRWVDARSQPRFSPSGEFLGAVGSCPDITELREADRRKDEFLALLSHELRNPLAPMVTALGLLRLNVEPQQTERARAVIERQIRHMTRLIEELVDVSRLSRGTLLLRLETFDIIEALRTGIETSRPLIADRGHELLVDVPTEAIPVNGDATRLGQVFSNLLNNAAKFTETGGQIRLTAVRQDASVVVSVKDTGIGIAPEHLTRLFEMFRQVDTTSEYSQFGLGVGLALTKRVVEMHGGTVEARSEGVGRGTEFVVHLPALHSPLAPELESRGNPSRADHDAA